MYQAVVQEAWYGSELKPKRQLHRARADAEDVIAAMQEIRKRIGKRTRLWVGGVGNEKLAEAANKLGWLALKNFHELEGQLDVLAAEN